MKQIRKSAPRSNSRVRGLSLIELMIAMLLGLLVVGAAIGIFLTNRQTYAATESLGRVQENVRSAFELMARDIRETAGNPCSKDLPVANVVTAPQWWANWAVPVQGYDNGALAGTAPGTDAIQILSSGNAGATVLSHNAAGSLFTLTNASHGFVVGDVLMVCDLQQLSIFKASSVAGAVIGHAASGGNCSGKLGLQPVVCAPANTLIHTPNAVMARLHAARWYIKANGRNGNSLYQNVSGVEGEVAEGVANMQIEYLQSGSPGYVAATAITDWAQVLAARIDLTLLSQDRTGSDGNPLQRHLIHVVTLRSRNP